MIFVTADRRKRAYLVCWNDHVANVCDGWATAGRPYVSGIFDSQTLDFICSPTDTAAPIPTFGSP
jgi:hypothetical protein